MRVTYTEGRARQLAKTFALLPMWPLIWWQMGFDLQPCGHDPYGCRGCSWDDGKCCERAEAMVAWWRS